MNGWTDDYAWMGNPPTLLPGVDDVARMVAYYYDDGDVKRQRELAAYILARFEAVTPSRFTYACPHCGDGGGGYKLTAPTLDGRTMYLCLTCKRVALAATWVTDAKDGGE